MKAWGNVCGSLAAILFFLSAGVCAEKTITDYYTSIPLRLLDDYRFQLKSKNEKWTAYSGANIRLTPVIDIKNGYLTIVDAGRGGGALEHTLALYRTSEGRDILGVVLTRFDGVGIICKMGFYRPDRRWREVTETVLPKVDLSLYTREDYVVDPAAMGGLLEKIEFLYTLPRVGDTLRVKIELDRLIVSHGEKSQAEVREIIKQLKYREAKLLWDPKTAKFTYGEKTPFAPSALVKDFMARPVAWQANPVSEAPRFKRVDLPLGHPERKPILGALRKTIRTSSGLDMVFTVRYLRIKNDWAWIHALPQSRDGNSKYMDVSGLLCKTQDRWKLMERRPGDGGGDPDGYDDRKYFEKLKAKYPSAPPEIFPD